jgi:hypothetical protein
MARAYWPGTDPIGQRILWGGRKLTIVGIAGDVRVKTLEASPEPTIYNSVYQVESGATRSAVFVVRTSREAGALSTAVREVIWSVDRGLPVFDIRSMHQVFEESLAARRFTMTLLVWFASVAMMLAVMGLYSVHSYTVARRMPEMGVRLALGAKPARVVRHVLAGGLRLAGAGVLIGPVAGSAAATAMSSLLFGVKPLDPVAFVAAGTLLLAVAAAASYLPARRASQVDPLAALRSE